MCEPGCSPTPPCCGPVHLRSLFSSFFVAYLLCTSMSCYFLVFCFLLVLLKQDNQFQVLFLFLLCHICRGTAWLAVSEVIVPGQLDPLLCA